MVIPQFVYSKDSPYFIWFYSVIIWLIFDIDHALAKH